MQAPFPVAGVFEWINSTGQGQAQQMTVFPRAGMRENVGLPQRPKVLQMTFEVRIRPSGHRFLVEEDESVLDAALRQGIHLPYGCRFGGCGECKTRILEGRVRYPEGELPEALEASEAAEGMALLCQAQPETDLEIEAREVRLAEDLKPVRTPTKVVSIERLSHDVCRLRLKLPDSIRMAFLPGQYIEFILDDGRRRAFSLANAPHDDETLELHVRLVEGGAFTTWVFEKLEPKAVLHIEGPFGSFYLREDSDRPVIMVAGGTGFAPLKGMIEYAQAIGFRPPIHLFWGARSREDLYLDELPRRWVQSMQGFRYTPVLSEPRESDQWTGETGLVVGAVLKAYPELADFDIYMSGPPAMVESGRTAFLAAGAREDRLFSDAFDFAADTRRALAEQGGK